MITLGYTPFIDPLDLGGLWPLLLIPLALGISMTYAAVRTPEDDFWPGYRARTIRMTLKIVIGVALLGLIAHLFVRGLLPVIAPMPMGN